MPLVFVAVEDIAVRHLVLVGEIKRGKLDGEHVLVMFQNDFLGIAHRPVIDGRLEIVERTVLHAEVDDVDRILAAALAHHHLGVESQHALSAGNEDAPVVQAGDGVVLHVHHGESGIAVVVADGRLFAGVQTGQSVFRAEPQVVLVVLDDAGYDATRKPLGKGIVLQQRTVGLLVVTFQQVHAAAEHSQPDAPLCVFVEREHIVVNRSGILLFAIDFEMDVVRFLELARERHQSVGGAHPQSAVGIFGDGAHIEVKLVFGIVLELVVAVDEQRLPVALLNQVQTSAEGAGPDAVAGILEDVIHAVVVQRIAVVGVVNKVGGLPSFREGLGVGFYYSISLRAEPEIAGMVFHDVIHVAYVVHGRRLHGLRLGVDAEQRAVAGANP